MFLSIWKLFSNIGKHFPLSQITFIRTLEDNQRNGNGTYSFPFRDETSACLQNRIKDSNSSWCTLVLRVWLAICFIHVADTCSSSNSTAYVLLVIVVGSLQIQQSTTLYNGSILYSMTQSGFITGIPSTSVKPNKFYKF